MMQIKRLQTTKIKPGVNLLVGTDKVEAAKSGYSKLKEIINPDQIIVIPQRFSNTPTPNSWLLLQMVNPSKALLAYWDASVRQHSSLFHGTKR